MEVVNKIKAPRETEKIVLEYLKKQNKPITFYNLYKNLDFTAGKAQSAIKRLKKKNQIYVKKRVKRFENLVWYKDFSIESEIIDLKDQNEVIFPFRLNRTIGLILKEIPELSSNYDNLTDVFKEAIVYFFQNSLSYELKEEAIYQAINKGNISEKIGKQILGS